MAGAMTERSHVGYVCRESGFGALDEDRVCTGRKAGRLQRLLEAPSGERVGGRSLRFAGSKPCILKQNKDIMPLVAAALISSAGSA